MKPTVFAPLEEGRRTNWGVAEVLGKYHISTLERYWLSRTHIALFTIALLLGAYFEPESLTHELFDKGGPHAWTLVWMVCGVCALGLADVVLNDLCPWTRCELFRRYRHIVYFLIAIGNFAVSYVFVAESGNWFRALVLPYWLTGVFTAFVAILDLFERHRGRQ